MTSKECVLKAIKFQNPGRIPLCVDLDGNDSLSKTIKDEVDKELSSDKTDILFTWFGDPQFVPTEKGLTEWGYRWDTVSETRGEVTDPPIKDWSEFDEWAKNAPDFTLSRRYDHARKIRKEHPDKFIVGGLGLLATEHINLRGFGESMEDLYIEREYVEALLDVLYGAAEDAVDGFAGAGIDAVISWEDWGLQDRAIIDPKLWREIYYDRMKKLVKRVHDHGMIYILHSCGYILDYIDMFIELGIDVIQQDQQMNMGFEELSKWRGKICFFCPVDVQHSPDMDDKQIAEYAQKMARNLGDSSGGFMYKAYAQPSAIHMPAKNIVSEVRAFESIRIAKSK